jgi:myo-inositol 2-dehydrogenase / D-chiro-inositol 1-dehydrogenase
MVNLLPQANNVKTATSAGISHEVQPEYWQRFEDAFATEANEFINSILEDTKVPLPMEVGLKVLRIGWALQEALLTGNVVRFNKDGEREDGRDMMVMVDGKPKL